LRAICLVTNTSVEWLVMGRGERKPKERVDDTSGSGGPGPLPKVNPGLMEDVIETVGLDTKIEGVALTPGKCSALLTLVYNASCATRLIDHDAAEAALRLARA
jgi:hypothetical protein